MSATSRASRHPARQAWRLLREVGALFSTTGLWLAGAGAALGGLGLAMGVFLGLSSQLLLAAWYGLLAVVGGIVFLAVGVGVPAVVQRRQSSSLVHLVPGHERTLRRVLAWNWIAALATITLGALVTTPLFQAPPGLSGVLAGMSVAALFMALIISSPARPVVILLATPLFFLPVEIGSALRDAYAALQAGVGAGSVLAFLGLAWGLHRALQHAHWRGSAVERAARSSNALAGCQADGAPAFAAAASRTGTGLLDTLALGPLARRLALRRGRTWRPSVRIRLALGPGWSPWALLSHTVPLVLGAVPLLLLLQLSLAPAGSVDYRFGASHPQAFSMIAILAAIGTTSGFLATLGATRTEQALAMLLPGAPAPAARSRWLCDATLRLWAAYSAALIVGWLSLALLLGMQGWRVVQLLQFLLCAAALDLVATQWAPRRFRHATTAQANLLAGKLLICLLLGALGVLGKAPAVTWLTCLLWCASAVAVALWLRVRRLRDAPALPLGQFG